MSRDGGKTEEDRSVLAVHSEKRHWLNNKDL
jgi:hypothetical protein